MVTLLIGVADVVGADVVVAAVRRSLAAAGFVLLLAVRRESCRQVANANVAGIVQVSTIIVASATVRNRDRIASLGGVANRLRAGVGIDQAIPVLFTAAGEKQFVSAATRRVAPIEGAAPVIVARAIRGAAEIDLPIHAGSLSDPRKDRRANVRRARLAVIAIEIGVSCQAATCHVCVGAPLEA